MLQIPVLFFIVRYLTGLELLFYCLYLDLETRTSLAIQGSLQTEISHLEVLYSHSNNYLITNLPPF